MSRGAAALPALGTFAALLLAFGCAGGEGSSGPPEITYGVDECSRCRMILSDERFAAAARAPSGEALRFDDPGCLIAYLQEAEAASVPGWRAWVQVLDRPGWVAVEEAHFALVSTQKTPMGSGVAAYASAATARATTGEEGLRWQELLENYTRLDPQPPTTEMARQP